MEQGKSETELNTIKMGIFREIPYIDIKPFSHNIISLELRLISEKYGIKELEHEQETALAKDVSPTFFLTDFPEYTSPFWNMKRYDEPKQDIAKKVDVILSGQETFGSAERETDPVVMRERFETISEGGYKKKLFDLFGEERTTKEMDDFFKFDFFKRSGGGIGMTRLIRSMKTEGLMPDFNKED